jgi:hypothetical protein
VDERAVSRPETRPEEDRVEADDGRANAGTQRRVAGLKEQGINRVAVGKSVALFFAHQQTEAFLWTG